MNSDRDFSKLQDYANFSMDYMLLNYEFHRSTNFIYCDLLFIHIHTSYCRPLVITKHINEMK